MPELAQFILEEQPLVLADLKKEWQKTLVAPQDGMWESFRQQAAQWSARLAGKTIGFAQANKENGLLNFYVQPDYWPQATAWLQQFLAQEKIEQAILGTQNPVALSLALHLQRAVVVDTYLFAEPDDELFERNKPAEVQKNKLISQALFQEAQPEDLSRLVDFYHHAMGGPKNWLNSYLAAHLDQAACYFLEREGEIIGACEVRNSQSQPPYADIGMVVGLNYRRKGVGSYLLGQAAAIARSRGRAPICSCEADNIGSRKSIEATGLRSIHQLLRLSFLAGS